MLNGVMAVDPNLVQLTPADDLRIDEQSAGVCVSIEERVDETGKFFGHSIKFVPKSGANNFGEAKFLAHSLAKRAVLAKRSISDSVYIARDVSKLRNSLSRELAKLRDASTPDCACLRRFSDSLCAMFTPIFMSRGESADELDKIRGSLGDLLVKEFGRKSAKKLLDQCLHILDCSGAMALFGVLQSALRAAK
jgi:hypothetical protein